MAKYRVNARLPGGMGMPPYDGYVDVHAFSPEAAQKEAARKIRETHGRREIVWGDIVIRAKAKGEA